MPNDDYVIKEKCYKNTKAFETLDSFSSLDDNWNGNDAKPFKNKLIEKCKKVLSVLPETLQESCFVAPTACDSIQFEWEKGQKYYEIEVCEDFMKLFVADGDDVVIHKVFHGEKQIENIIERLVSLSADA